MVVKETKVTNYMNRPTEKQINLTISSNKYFNFYIEVSNLIKSGYSVHAAYRACTPCK